VMTAVADMAAVVAAEVVVVVVVAVDAASRPWWTWWTWRLRLRLIVRDASVRLSSDLSERGIPRSDRFFWFKWQATERSIDRGISPMAC